MIKRTREEAIEYLEIERTDYDIAIYRESPIREALNMAIEALKEPERKKGNEWIPLKTRPMDEDERKELADKLGYEPKDYEAVIYTSPFPDVGQEVLICLKSGDIRIDSFEDDADGFYHYWFADLKDVAAWMPLPKPYERREKK